MKITYLFFLAAIVFCGTMTIMAQTSNKNDKTAVKDQATGLRYDGLYCLPGESSQRCLRFYDDGLVLAVSLDKTLTDADFVKVLKWFHRDNFKGGKRRQSAEGTYKINKKNITFSTTTNYVDLDQVTIDYAGTIEDSGAALVLETYSHVNGNRTKDRRFEFIEMKP